MKTVIELYDRERILNVTAALTFMPKRMYIMGSRESLTQEAEGHMQSFFARRGQDIRVVPIIADMKSPYDVMQKLGDILRLDREAVIDVTGGRDLTLVASGMAAQKYGTALIYFDRKEQRFINVSGCSEADGREFTDTVTVREFFALYGAAVSGHSHIDPARITDDTLSKLKNSWRFFLRMGEDWQKLSRAFQTANTHAEPDDPQRVSLSADDADIAALRELESLGLIKGVKDSHKTIEFRYKDETVKRVLSTTGAWLEVHVYKTALDSGLFNDVDMDVVIDWNGGERMPGDPINEMDVCLMRGTRPLFVSCKTGSFSAQDINEFAGLVKRLGGLSARGAFVTSHDRDAIPLGMTNRLSELGITLLDRSDIENGCIPQKLTERI